MSRGKPSKIDDSLKRRPVAPGEKPQAVKPELAGRSASEETSETEHFEKAEPASGLSIREWKNPEWQSNIPLILFMFAIVVFGLIILYSVSAPTGYINSKLTNSAFFVLSQLRFTIVGIVIALVVNFIPVDFFKNRLITS